jgi:hypothetical protein
MIWDLTRLDYEDFNDNVILYLLLLFRLEVYIQQ